MSNRRSLRGFPAGVLVGVLIGVVIGSAGLAAAAFGHTGWQRFSKDFKVGYVTGFLGMSNLARNLEPGGWVDMKYPVVPKAKPQEWAAMIDSLYSKPENQNYTINSMMQLAASKLQEKYGKESPQDRTLRRMQTQLEGLRKKREAAGEPEAKTNAIPVPEKVVPAGDGKKKKMSDHAPPTKWCRCDGTDPKAARAERKARAAAETGDDAGTADKPEGTKTPPSPSKTDEPAAKPPAAK